jgi:hypothetical protein
MPNQVSGPYKNLILIIGMNRIHPYYDIIVVGAGVAGLHCATELARRYPKKSICILEKYKTFGGRTMSYSPKFSRAKEAGAKCKSIPCASPIKWEAGAGRIHDTHRRTHGLLKKHGLHTIGIGSELAYMGKGGKPVPNIFETAVVPTILRPLQCLPAPLLARNTLRQILNRIFGDDRAEELVSWFPYRSEIDTLRADVALRSLVGGPMSSHTSYSVVAEGFSELVARMISDLPDNVVLLGRHEVIDVCPGPTKSTDLTVLYGGNKKMMLRAGEECIMAVHSEGLKHIGPFHTCAPLKQLKAEPLLRIYMIFPVGKGGPWFKGLGRVVFPDGLRYMIPIDETKGIIMISYTDGDDTKHYRKYIEKYGDESAELTRAVMRDVRRAFVGVSTGPIPDPTYTKAHYWSVGATYWLPGTENVEELSRRLLHPYPQSLPGVYVCGESYSPYNQAWVEGALETAEKVLKLI